jgi:hypothetical protein
MDPNDAKLKAKGLSGTVTVLAILGAAAGATGLAYSPLGLGLLNLALTPQAAAIAHGIRKAGPFAFTTAPYASGLFAPSTP